VGPTDISFNQGLFVNGPRGFRNHRHGRRSARDCSVSDRSIDIRITHWHRRTSCFSAFTNPQREVRGAEGRKERSAYQNWTRHAPSSLGGLLPLLVTFLHLLHLHSSFWVLWLHRGRHRQPSPRIIRVPSHHGSQAVHQRQCCPSKSNVKLRAAGN
jgi:hypothetical protein